MASFGAALYARRPLPLNDFVAVAHRDDVLELGEVMPDGDHEARGRAADVLVLGKAGLDGLRAGVVPALAVKPGASSPRISHDEDALVRLAQE